MSKAEKENRITSFALTFLEQQQVRPNIFADQIVRAYKEGYHQAEKDNELTVEDIVYIIETYNELEFSREFATVTFNDTCKEVLKRFKERKEK